MSGHRHHPAALVMHVHELGTVVEVWREGLGWWAKTARGHSQRGYPTPEQALAAPTGSWPHEAWLTRVGTAARRHACATAAASSSLVRIADARAATQRRADGAALDGAVIELRSRRRFGDDRASLPAISAR